MHDRRTSEPYLCNRPERRLGERSTRATASLSVMLTLKIDLACACSRKSARPGNQVCSQAAPGGSPGGSPPSAARQNDDIDPAAATGRGAAAERASSAACMGSQVHLRHLAAEPGRLQRRRVRRIGIRDDDLGAGPDVVLVHPPHRVRLLQVGARAPRRPSIGTPSACNWLPMPPSTITTAPAASRPATSSATPMQPILTGHQPLLPP